MRKPFESTAYSPAKTGRAASAINIELRKSIELLKDAKSIDTDRHQFRRFSTPPRAGIQRCATASNTTPSASNIHMNPNSSLLRSPAFLNSRHTNKPQATANMGAPWLKA